MYTNLAEVIIKLEALVYEQQKVIQDQDAQILMARIEIEGYREAAEYYKSLHEKNSPKDPKTKWDDFFKPKEN